MHDKILPRIWHELDILKKSGMKKTYESMEQELDFIEKELREYVEMIQKP